MARSTGPILAAGAINLTNQTILADKPLATGDNVTLAARIGIATGLMALGFYGIEKISPELAVGLAWTGLVTMLFVRFHNQPTPLERVVNLL